MKPTRMLWGIIFCFIVAACGGGDTTNVENVDAPKYLDSWTVTADQPTPAPTLGKAFYTQQFHATAHYSDGTTKDASGIVTWTTSNNSIIAIDHNGLGTINLNNIYVNNLYGDVTIWAEFSTAFDSVILTVSPPATGEPVDSLVWDVEENQVQ